MSSPKRRKLNGAETPPLSAFAARQRLRAQKGLDTITSASHVEVVERDASATKASDAAKVAPSLSPVSRAVEGMTAIEEALALVPAVSVQDGGHNSSSLPAAASTSLQRSSAVQEYTSIKLTKKNHQRHRDGSWTLDVPPGERLVLYGSYGLQITAGEVIVYGASLRAGDNVSWVHAPLSHALPVIRSMSQTTLRVLPHPSRSRLRQLESLSRLFGRIWASDDVSANFDVAYASDSPPEALVQLLTVTPAWNKAITELDDAASRNNTIVCVAGPKSSGKSTFCKLLANRWITRPLPDSALGQTKVAFLDIDPGQAEYSPPGVISLLELGELNFSPSFCHPAIAEGSRNKVLRSHALAAITPSQDPDHYTACVLDLLAEYHRIFRGRCPLIINTPGWIQGSGLDLLCGLLRRMRPGKVFYMSQDGPAETVEGLTEACGADALTTLPSQLSEHMTRTALQLRTMQTLSYFHVDPKMSGEAGLQWDPRPLTEMAPWIVPYSGPNRGFVGVIFYGSTPAPELIAEAINGAVVALVKIEDAARFDVQASTIGTAGSRGMDVNDPGQSQPGDSHEKIPLLHLKDGETLDPKHSQLMCLVLVRGVDTKNRTLHLLSPIPEVIVKDLQERPDSFVLVAGSFETPTWAYAEDLYKRSWSSALQSTDNSLSDGDSEGEQQGIAAVPAESLTVQNTLEESNRPWVAILHGNEKRAVGSRAWRVRRDLGRSASGMGLNLGL